MLEFINLFRKKGSLEPQKMPTSTKASYPTEEIIKLGDGKIVYVEISLPNATN